MSERPDPFRDGPPPLRFTDETPAVPVTPEPARRTPEQVREVMKEVSWLSRVLSGRYGIKVAAIEGDGAWTCGIDPKYAGEVHKYIEGEIDSLDHLPSDALVPKVITVRKNDLFTDPLIEIRRKTRHEAAHGAYSDFKLFFQGMRQAKQEGYLPSSYGSLMNGPEDGWVNAMAAGESQAALEDLRRGYQEKLAEILPQLPQDPLPRQFGINAINYWLTGRDVPGIDPQVLEAMERVRPAFDRFYASRSAHENFETFINQIWPQVRDLEKQEINNQVQRNMAQQAQSGDQGQSQEGQQGQSGQGGEQQGQGQQGGQGQQSGEGQSQGQGSGSPSGGGSGQPTGEGQSGGSGQSSGGGQPQLPEDLKRKIQQELSQSQGQSQAQSQAEGQPGQGQQGQQSQGQSAEQQGSPSDGQPSGQGQPSNESGKPGEPDLSKLSPETLAELEKFIESLDPQTREQLEEAARQQTDQKQSEKLNKEAPQVIQMEKNEETGQYEPKIQTTDEEALEKAMQELQKFEQEEETRERQEREQQNQEARRQEAERLRQKVREQKLQQMREEGFTEAEEGAYDLYKQKEAEVRPAEKALDQQVMRAFPREFHVVQTGYYYSGRPDPRQIARRFPIGDGKFHTRKDFEQKNKIDTFLWLVIDVTGSMREGDKMEETTKNAILWSLATEKYEIPFGMILMGSSATILKNPNQPYSDPEARIKANLIAATQHLQGSTNYSAAVGLAQEQLLISRRKIPGAQGVIMFLTDGQPNTGTVGPALVAEIEQIKKNFELFAFGLTDDPSEQATMRNGLVQYFGEERVIIPQTMAALIPETQRVMTPILRRIGQKLRQGT